MLKKSNWFRNQWTVALFLITGCVPDVPFPMQEDAGEGGIQSESRGDTQFASSTPPDRRDDPAEPGRDAAINGSPMADSDMRGGPRDSSKDDGRKGADPETPGEMGASEGEPALEGDPCMLEGALRCVGSAGPARQRCTDGVFLTAEPCAAGELCDPRPEASPGTCVAPASFCVGHADEYVCVGSDLHRCSNASVSVEVTRCESDRHCQTGLGHGACGDIVNSCGSSMSGQHDQAA
ncbi:MAG: hypothetical protein OXU20_38800, partial [Myxococcales bacterium]|nr:hypothetical protein [Myxococcales bacterium]